MSTEQVVERPVEARTDVAALLAGLVTVTLWGSAFVAIRDVGKSISPGSVALGRLLVSLVVLGLAAAIWREPLPRSARPAPDRHLRRAVPRRLQLHAERG